MIGAKKGRCVRNLSGVLLEPLENRQLLSAMFANAGQTALAYDQFGNLHVAYYDTATRTLDYAERSAAGVWSAMVIVDAGKQVGSSLAIAVDSSGHTGIAYYDAKKGDLKYAYFNGVSWDITRVDSTGNVGKNPSLAFDLAGHPIISYFNQSGDDLKLAEFDGAKWTETVIDRGATAGQFSSIAINPVDGWWAIAYDQPGKRRLRYATQSGERLTLDTMSKAKGWTTDPSLAFAANGTPGISFYDPAAGSLKLAGFGSQWSIQTVISGNIGTASTLSFDPLSGDAQIAYLDRAGNSIDLTTDGTGGWSTVTLGSGDNLAVARNPLTNSFAALNTNGSDPSIVWALSDPTNLVASVVSNTQINLTWTDDSTIATGFEIDRSSDGGTNFSTLATVGATTFSYSDLTVGGSENFLYRVKAVDLTSSSNYVTSNAVTTPAPVPAAPTGLRVFAEGPTMFELIWNPVDGSATQVLVQDRLAGTSDAFQTLDTLTADQISDIVTLGPDGNPLTPNAAYEYRLIAVNADGDPSAESVHAEGSTGLIAPENLSAQALSATSVSMMWDSNSGASTNYYVYISTDGISYTLYSGTYQEASTLLLPDLSPATHYWLKVTATDGTNESAGTITQVDTMAATPGAAPINVSVQMSEDNPLYLNISWTNVASDAIGFHIQRSTDGVHFNTIEDVPVTWQSYDDPSVVEGTYYYRVQTFTASGDAGISAVASGTAFLANPVNLQATVTTPGTINLSWTNASTLATGLQLYAADAQGDPILVDDSVSPTATNYTVTQFADGTQLAAGATYWFYLVPTGDIPVFGSSQWVRVVNGFAAPSELDVTPTGDGQLTLNWTDVADETGYQIESSSDGVHFNNLVATVGANVTSYVVNGLPETADLYFRVMALGSGGNSAYAVSTRTAVAPNSPTSLVVTPIAGGSFDLSWDDNTSDAGVGYYVSFTTENGTVFIPAQPGAGATSCVVTEAELSGMGLPGRTFTVKVFAIQGQGQGASSMAAEVDNVQAI